MKEYHNIVIFGEMPFLLFGQGTYKFNSTRKVWVFPTSRTAKAEEAWQRIVTEVGDTELVDHWVIWAVGGFNKSVIQVAEKIPVEKLTIVLDDQHKILKETALRTAKRSGAQRIIAQPVHTPDDIARRLVGNAKRGAIGIQHN